MKTFVSYLVFNPLLCVNACERAMNPYILIDFCEHDAPTRRLASVGLVQARPNKEDLLPELHLATACLLSFIGSLRFNELVHIKPCDIRVQKGWMTTY